MVGVPRPIRHGLPVALFLLGTVLPPAEPTPAAEPPSDDLGIERPCWKYATCPAPTGEPGTTSEPTPTIEPPPSTTPPPATTTTAPRPTGSTGQQGGAAGPRRPAGTPPTGRAAHPDPAAVERATATRDGGLPGWVGPAAFGIGALLLLLGLAASRWLTWSERRGGWS